MNMVGLLSKVCPKIQLLHVVLLCSTFSVFRPHVGFPQPPGTWLDIPQLSWLNATTIELVCDSTSPFSTGFFRSIFQAVLQSEASFPGA